MNEIIKYFGLVLKNSLFWLSRKIDYPLLPPDILQLNFLYRCNLSCRMCSMKTKDHRLEVPLEVLKKLVDQAGMLGIKQALILGGEPFLSPGLFTLIKHVKKQKMISIVVTNGTLLNSDNLSGIESSGLDHLVISLDGSNEAILGAVRGPGVFATIEENIRKFNEFKTRHPQMATNISNCVTIMQQNIEDLLNIVELSRDWGVVSVVFQPVVANNTDQVKSGNISDTNIPSEKFAQMEMAIDRLIEFKKSSPENYSYVINSIRNLELIKKYFKGTLTRRDRKCYVGFNRFQVTQDNKVYFCVPTENNEVSFGNIQNDSIKDIWYSAKAKKYRIKAREIDCCCMQRCSYRDAFEEIESLWEKVRLFGIKFL
jgi:MoaA/NifB/PqqE/SkfB family radical SAM enzyme